MKKIYIIITIILIILVVIFSFYLGNMFANRTSIETTKDKIEEKEISTTYNITKTNEISEYIPKNINKITIINYLSDESNPTTKNVEDIDKIEEFMNLIFKTPWEEIDKNQTSTNFDGAFQKIVLIGDTQVEFSMQGYGGNNAIYGIIKIYNKYYYINKSIYQEMINYMMEKYYLHDSNLELPSQ